MLRATSFMPMVPSQTRLPCLVPLVREALIEEDRLTEGFRERLLGFRHGGGFSVYAKCRVMRSSGPVAPV